MNGDLSRVTFDPLKHFTRVTLLQGRVQVDADWNEHAAILLHYMRTLAADLIGQHGGPDDLFRGQANRTELIKRNCGFAIIATNGQPAGSLSFFPSDDPLSDDEKTLLQAKVKNRVPLLITPGHYYVDGLLCENETYWRYSEQPDLRQANDEKLRNLNGRYLLYLDVWERHITALEDPSILEVALGGADTAARSKLVWQIKIGPELPLPGAGPGRPIALSCTTFNTIFSPGVMNQLQPTNRGRIRAKAKEDSAADAADACITSPDARYRGMENQLYRVEIHQPGPALDATGSNREDAATFKWSRDNGTTVAALKRKDGDHLIVSGLRDFSRWFAAGNWIEVTHDALELNGMPGTLVRLAMVEGETLTIDPSTASGTVYEPRSKFNDLPVSNLKVRRWDHKQPEDTLLREGAITIEEKVWIELEDGLMIRFEPGVAAMQYSSGDYWLIPARVSTGDVEWPSEFGPDPSDPSKSIEQPQALPPHGIEHHYAPLAAVTLDAGQITGVIDLRHKFPAVGACSADAPR
ncbi:MAG: DUF6519 domain-containing protein [Acidobacteriota bacterium]